MSDFVTKPFTVDRLQQCDLYSGEVFSKAFLAGRVDAQSFRKKRLEIINTKWQLDHFHADAMTLKNIHIACTNKHSLTQKSFICCFRYYFKDPSPFQNKTENAVHPYDAIQSYNSEQY